MVEVGGTMFDGSLSSKSFEGGCGKFGSGEEGGDGVIERDASSCISHGNLTGVGMGIVHDRRTRQCSCS